MKKIIIYTSLISILLAIAFPVFAININNPAPGFFIDWGKKNTFAGLLYFLVNNLLVPVAGTIALVFIIIGGFKYIMARGNEEAAEDGKKTLTNALIGLVIVILSYVIVVVVVNALFGKTDSRINTDALPSRQTVPPTGTLPPGNPPPNIRPPVCTAPNPYAACDGYEPDGTPCTPDIPECQ